MRAPCHGHRSRSRRRSVGLFAVLVGLGAVGLAAVAFGAMATAGHLVPSRGVTAIQAAETEPAMDAAAMIAAHNHWRQAVGVPELRWSGQLAARAQQWADQLQRTRGCEPEHSPATDVGENVFWASAIIRSGGRRSVNAVTPADVVTDWAAERANLDVRTNRCAVGMACGHYTQIIWKDTREVGCGRAICSDSSQVWVCDYLPPGNEVGR